MQRLSVGVSGGPAALRRPSGSWSTLWTAAVGALTLGVIGGGCGSSEAEPSSDGGCVPNETQDCFGPGRCEGSQSCLEDGSGFTECDCGEPASGAGGTSGRGGSGGDGGDGNRATGGTAHMGGMGATPGTGALSATGGVGAAVGTGAVGGIPATGGTGAYVSTGAVGGTWETGGWGHGGEPGGEGNWGHGGEGAHGGEPLVAGAGGDPTGGTAGLGGYATGGVAGGYVCNESGAHTVNVAIPTEVRTFNYNFAEINVMYKRDVDVQDGGGCVSRVRIHLDENGECLLMLRFEAVASDSALWLQSAVLDIDSRCPGWSDSQEGWYELTSAPNSATLDLSDEVAEDGSRYESCLTATLRPSGVITLERRGEAGQLTIDLSSLQITDSFLACGEEDACCPGEACLGGGGATGSAGSDGVAGGY